RRRHTRSKRDWSSDVCSSDLIGLIALCETAAGVTDAIEIAQHPAVVALMWGAEDLMVSTGGSSSRFANGTYRDIPRFARAQVLRSEERRVGTGRRGGWSEARG